MFSTVNLIGYSVADPGQVARGSLSSAEKYTARLKYRIPAPNSSHPTDVTLAPLLKISPWS